MWIKQGTKISGPILVNLNTSITQEIIEHVSKTTTRIPVTIGQEEREPVTDENRTITTTVGYLQIETQEGCTYEYQLVKLPNKNYTRFVELAKEISSFAKDSNSYRNISKINEFYNLYNDLIPEKWNKVDNRIEQPEDAKNGDEYVVWIRSTNSNGEKVVDVQFMTSVREEKEKTSVETVKEEVTKTTKLPVTFDSNIILIIVLAVIIVAIIVLFIVKKKLDNKNK